MLKIRFQYVEILRQAHLAYVISIMDILNGAIKMKSFGLESNTSP